ncbi:MAG: formate--tetrahydrofolate ligase [Acidobacteria bacterium 13_1_40CM_3_56_11]|nr:MAG: formate--tetrahydrofolate ligase [Acidobacteria bacterium 13_1_40CM_3_56_11]
MFRIPVHDQHQTPKTDIEIAQEAHMLPIAQIGHRKLGIHLSDLFLYGHFKAKISLDYLNTLQPRPNAKLILITAITPTAAGEGKTTTTVGLGDALNRIGKPAIVCLREPSLGPCFGVKGGAAGGGYAQVLPMEDINLHFTGDLHAVGAANNLLAALVDNHIYWGNSLGLDARRIFWRRAVDMNDRSLRQITIALGGVGNGFPREDGWDIIAASEIMAVFCLAESIDDLKRRLGNMIVGQTRDRKYIRASDFEAAGAMTALLKDAFAPNLVQTIENNPALIHGGPFANIAHGCNSVIATKSALKLADYVVTEAGFGADLGAEKFMNIKCRKAGLRPDCAVVVATIRALKMHGGMNKDALKQEDLPALERGFTNLARHVENVRKFGVPVVVAINRFTADTEAENALLKSLCEKLEVESITADHWAKGGEGAVELAEAVVKTIETNPSQFRPLYDDNMPLWKKAQTIAREMYGADDIIGDQKIRDRFRELQDQGYGHFPVCIAKTQYSFTTDPDRKGAPKNHVVPIREVRLSAGAEFIVAICGDIMTMPGLPKVPAANKIDVTPDGRIIGLF